MPIHLKKAFHHDKASLGSSGSLNLACFFLAAWFFFARRLRAGDLHAWLNSSCTGSMAFNGYFTLNADHVGLEMEMNSLRTRSREGAGYR